MSIVRFSVRRAAVQRAAATQQAALWMPRRWQSEEAAKEGEAKEGAEQSKELKEALEQVAKLQEQLKDKDGEIKELKEKALYIAADAENARRIAREDVAKAKDFSVTGFAKDMLEVSDTLTRAVQAFEKLPEEQVEANPQMKHVLTGVKMSESVLLHNLSRHGVEDMKAAVGHEFDPNKHDALFNSPATDEVKAGCISNVVKTGFMIKERVLRAAQVGVAQDQ